MKKLFLFIACLFLSSPALATTYFVAGTGGATTGSDANACTDWSIPCATVAGALGKATPTIIAVDKTGSFVATAAITWTPPATGIAIISSTNGVTGTTIAYSPGAAESIGAASNNFVIAGAAGSSMYVYGMTLTGTTNNATNNIVVLGTATANDKIIFQSCTLSVPTINTSAVISFGNGATKGTSVTAIDTTFSFGSRTGNAFIVVTADVELINPTFTFGATKPSPLFSGAATASPGKLNVRDGDISSFTGAALIAANTIDNTSILLQNLKISATPTITTGTWNPGNGSITLRNVDSADTTYAFQYINAFGTLTAENTDYVTTSGATFNGAPIGWKVVTSALANESFPFVLPPLAIWNTTTTAQTYAIEIAQVNGAAALTDRQIWSDIDYANSTSFPSYTQTSNRSAGPFVTTGVAHATSTNPWTVPNIGASPVTQKLQSGTATTPASFTASETGLLLSIIKIGVATLTMWINPQIDGVQ